ncbi:uncharacterized protein N7473_011704 [Penicillium subrubescens]|uniref:uncharacterized protein n=1 Tax=Penicillium subrubescens TaxID=1316194 RepID=UPI0025450A69|nr:uncharacterized protein N7473_011704 [Penicillium subrubescens]KAJ5880651.1 hypothetical protein N7473_011704 [Penicillium subrubescens]
MATYSYAQYPGQHMNSAMHNVGNPAMAGNFPRSHFNPQTRSFVPGVLGHSGTQAKPNWPRFPESVPNHTFEHSPATNAARNPSTPSQTSIAKWGTPSHLPPKPPPSEVPSGFEIKHRAGSASLPAPAVPSNGLPSAPKNGPLVVSGGTTTSKMN